MTTWRIATSLFLLLPLASGAAVTLACSGREAPRAPAPCASAVTPPEVAGTARQDDAAAKVLDDWHDAAAKADETRYFDHFAKGAVFLGTDGTERWTLTEFRAYAHPHFAKGKAWSFRSTRRDVTFLADVAWFDEDLDTPNLGPARGSGVLVKDEHGVWRIAQYNLSVPIPNDRFKDVKALIDAGR